MRSILFNLLLLYCLTLLLFPKQSNAQTDSSEQHVLVSMRMIGHEILLNAGDSISRVFPVENVDNRYKISFESGFGFDPGQLVATVDSIIRVTKTASGYIVEVEECKSRMVVYNYEKDPVDALDIVPCGSRNQPWGCYEVFITITAAYSPLYVLNDPDLRTYDSSFFDNVVSKPMMQIKAVVLVGLIIIFLLIIVRRRTRSSRYRNDLSLVYIGKYIFNPQNMSLSLENESIELSGKEADLLLLLHNSANNTVEREVILKEVWGDEGDYVGRTPDVFISKLRKKLGADSNIKIINIRGVGYRLVIEAE